MQRWIRRLIPDRRFLGSTVAFVLGVLHFLSVPAALEEGRDISLVAGPITILGAVAYRSRKRRLLGLASAVMARKISEGLALLVILLAVGLQRDLGTLMVIDPFPNLVLPLWAVIAYFGSGIRITIQRSVASIQI